MQTTESRVKYANKLTSTKRAGQLVNEYWEMVFRAKQEGKLVCWYEGSAINPFLQAADICWVHGEAFSAMLAARHMEEPVQKAAEDYGYMRELCSYARTHLGCVISNQRLQNDQDGGLIDLATDENLAAKLPAPDMIISAYAYCSTGQQWDEITSRLFGKKIPIFNVSIPVIWGSKPDAGYLRGQEWEQTSDYLEKQLYAMVEFIEQQTGKPFAWDRLRELMTYVKRASELRLEAMAMCAARPAPASFFDWIVTIAPLNHLPIGPQLVEFFQAVRDEIEERVRLGVGTVPREKYRLYFDGIMNWNKVGWLAEKFAKYDAAVMCGRYTHVSFWHEPQLIDEKNPVRGMAQNYLICAINLSAPFLIDKTIDFCRRFDLDGLVIHSSRTCRAFTNPQFLIAEAVTKELGIPTTMFEGDVTDESFYKDELLNSRVEAMLEAIDAGRNGIVMPAALTDMTLLRGPMDKAIPMTFHPR
ncbi:2-hydroxyacyl-CoA dehydratase subunit D [Hydrogenophaga sp.]|uniref:2-hydroxyacyl-CoA dehydratase subunit D n=1 Tax=Hydrogenophaga sp. TaxID=1904254 RepID=UPI002719EA04|nr:2-hydroxyacyl-CoA dehydratase family protein [Hydrogenophaga sp.]MDO9439082.1 2-hydroxyacyl-CoA dehydratase family protein [Hydrogenophaga sp.]